MTSTNQRIGGIRKEVDYRKLGPAVLIASSLVLAIRTARCPPTHSDGLADVEWEKELEHSARIAKAMMSEWPASGLISRLVLPVARKLFVNLLHPGGHLRLSGEHRGRHGRGRRRVFNLVLLLPACPPVVHQRYSGRLIEPMSVNADRCIDVLVPEQLANRQEVLRVRCQPFVSDDVPV